jgi:hypothetical protein
MRLSFLLIVEFQWLSTSLPVLPGSLPAMSDQLRAHFEHSLLVQSEEHHDNTTKKVFLARSTVE